MSTLRRMLIMSAGWGLGVIFTLAWVWIYEGKAEPQTGGIYIVLTILSSILSAFTLGSTLVLLASFVIDGRER